MRSPIRTSPLRKFGFFGKNGDVVIIKLAFASFAFAAYLPPVRSSILSCYASPTKESIKPMKSISSAYVSI